MISQRESGFNGGIKNGCTAHTVESVKLDKIVCEASKSPEVIRAAQKKGLVRRDGLRNTYLAEMYQNYGIPVTKDEISGIVPDGGIFMNSKGTPVLSFEAKKQGARGNAIERLWKNLSILRDLNPHSAQGVFCHGDGFFDGNSCDKIIKTHHILKTIRYSEQDREDYGMDPFTPGNVFRDMFFRSRGKMPTLELVKKNMILMIDLAPVSEV